MRGKIYPYRGAVVLPFLILSLLLFLSLSGCSPADEGGEEDFDGGHPDPLFVAVGITGTVLYSTDGNNWMNAGPISSQDLNGVTYWYGQFFAAGSNGKGFRSSTGGAGSWVDTSAPTPNTLWDITSGAGRLVAVGNVGTIGWSPDGSPGSWVNASPGGNDLYDICFRY